MQLNGCILRFGKMEKRNDTFHALLKRPEGGMYSAFQVRLVLDGLSSDSLVLELLPNVFARIVFWSVPRQEKDPQLATMGAHERPHLARTMKRRPVRQQD